METIFEKPKRKLSEKQLANLAKGREKMRLKRLAAKQDKVGHKEHKKVASTSIKKKRNILKEQAALKEQEILKEIEQKDAERDEYESRFLSAKMRCLEQAKSVREYKEIKGVIDGLDYETLKDEAKLEAYARAVMGAYTQNIISVDSKEDACEESEEEGSDHLPDQDE